jgi:hypothetical protein
MRPRKQTGDLVLVHVIEVMPLGDIDESRLDQYLPLSIVRARLAERYTLDDIDYRTGGPARYVRVKETGGRLGFITPLTHNFCESCNRVRITCTGTLYMCLGQNDAADLRGPLRASESDEPLHAAAARIAAPYEHDRRLDQTARCGVVTRSRNSSGRRREGVNQTPKLSPPSRTILPAIAFMPANVTAITSLTLRFSATPMRAPSSLMSWTGTSTAIPPCVYRELHPH